MTQPILQIKNLVLGYDAPLNKPFSLDINEGSTWAFIGDNGSGKTTLLRTLLGLVPPYSGVNFWKKDCVKSYVPQERNLDLTLPFTTKDFLNMSLITSRPYHKRPIQNEILSLFKIEPLLRKKMSDLSGGQKQKVLLARSLLAKPDVVFLDEAWSFLDEETKTIFTSWIESKKGHFTLIFVEHHEAQIRKMADHVLKIGHEITKL